MYLPCGSSTGPGGRTVSITPESAGWTYCGLSVVELSAGGDFTFDTGEHEHLVLPLSGGCEVRCEDALFRLTGRTGVFDRVTDFAYVPIDATVTVTAHGGPARFALPSARARRRLPARYGPAENVPVEVRGAGTATRQLNNFCAPDAFACDRLVAVEVLTPGGNWSSYPPHKHDTATSTEAVLEEIYYFETTGPAYQRVYGTTEVLAEVSTGDVVLVPDGYHGPSMAAPGYDLYYLNVLAGPGEERSMACRDDPAHHHVRRSWDGVAPDPRVPMTGHEGRTP